MGFWGPATRYDPREQQHTDSGVFGRTVSGGGAAQVPVGTVLEGFHYILFVSREQYEQANALIDEVFERRLAIVAKVFERSRSDPVEC